MGFFKNIFNRTEEEVSTDSTSSDETQVDDVLLKALLSGEKIDTKKALSIPAVSSSVDIISGLVAMCPISLYEQESGEDNKITKKEIKDDIRVKLLNVDSGDSLDCFQMKKNLVMDYFTKKGGYIFIEKDFNTVKSLRYVEPDYITPIKNVDPIFKDAKYQVYGKDYETFQFIKLLRNTKDGYTGTSVVSEVSKSLETAFTTILYELGLVKKGGGKKGFLTSTKKLGKEEITALKKAWREYYSNSNENVIVLNDGLKFEEGASTSVELQTNERKKTLQSEIKDIFHLNGDYNTNIKTAIMPVIRAIESSLNRDLLLESEKGKFFFSFNTKELTRGSLKERYEAYKIAKETGWMGLNEIRTEEDKEEIPGLDVIPMNLADVLFDVKTKQFFTPNTGKVQEIKGGESDENTNQE